MATYTVGGRGARSGSGSYSTSNAGLKNSYIARMMEGGGIGALGKNEQHSVRQMLSPDEYAQFALGRGGAGGGGSGGSGGGSGSGGSGSGGSIDANSLLELYQKGLGANSGGGSTEDQLTLLREGNKLDLQRKSEEQRMQLEGQEKVLAQTQQARAKERETEANLQRKQQTRERDNAMAAFRSL